MRHLISFALLAFATLASPAIAADKAATKDVPQTEIEMPEIMIILPAAKFEHAIVRDNEEPVVLLLV
jgi:hypothetical protein